MTNQNLSTLLAQVSSIAVFKTTSLGLTRLDKDASRESDRTHGAKDGTVRANVYRLTPIGTARVKDISSCANEVKAQLYGMTTTWGDYRLISNKLISKWLGIWGNGKKEYDALVQKLIDDAPQLIADSEVNLQGFKVAPPTEAEIKAAFSMTYDMLQVPDASKYQPTGLDKALEGAMKRQFEAGIEAAYQNATADALKRVAKPLGHLVDKLKKYSDGDSKRLYDSTITNVQDIAAVFEDFNLKGDPFMAKIAEQLHAFDGIEPNDLKSSDALRQHVSKTAETILAELADLI